MATSKKILPVPADLASDAEALCTAMTKKFVDPAGAPYFQFKVEEGNLVAEGDAWKLSGSQRPAMGTMASYAEGYIQCIKDR